MVDSKSKLAGSIRPTSVAGDTLFSFKTSGLKGGDSSQLEITIDGGSAQMNIAVDGAPMSAGATIGRSVVVRFMGDIELKAAAEGLEFLARHIRESLTPSGPALQAAPELSDN